MPRTQTATSEEDRVIASHLKQASREVQQALLVARGTSRSSRSRRVERELGGILRAMVEISSITSRYLDFDDPDLISEEERNRLSRERRKGAPEPVIDETEQESEG